ncbi:hypothetical protein AMAG_15262 [Allomyces macrogynus ATCC 38327]|uniref:Uncharacterized protein n=1 Tax=Allomyces macrogynus (strain ATCC 38327) TaxID=578462 RepID=A0A0L0T8D7_ALLM3|nr:hypothetical protein AMAG_15262 [Allomyces macrogynus ATCC 38327]|eukprot:KNE71002.1 hypothetical protein AMAG_15262 [Allomyces macrogynus ATCC 38327]
MAALSTTVAAAAATIADHAPAPTPTPCPSYFGRGQAADQAAAGFLAGAASTALLHPLDLVKTRFQADTSSKRPRITLLASARALASIARGHGIRGLYQGLAPNFAGATASWGGEHLVAAAEAGALTCLATNPIWLVKTRMCLQSPTAPQYNGLFDALTQIARTEGLRGLYRGLTPALFGVSHGAIQFMVYEDLKRHASHYSSTHDGASWLLGPTFEYIFNAVTSKVVASVATYPYQLVKTRLQSGAARYGGVVDVVRQTWKGEGLVGFYKGLGANVLRVMPGTCVTFVVYETTSKFFRTHAQ